MLFIQNKHVHIKCQYIFVWTTYKRHTNNLPLCTKYQRRATRIITDTITVEERAANVINSTTLGPRVAVELDPNVCEVN